MFGRWGKKSTDSAVPVTSSNVFDEKIKFEVIINSIEDGVILINSSQVIQLSNPGAGVISGWPSDEAVGIDIHNVLKLVDDKGEAYGNRADPFKMVFENGQVARNSKATLINRAKKQIPISLSVTPLLDQQGQVTAAIVVFRDVAQERAEEQQRADFISTASHEMRTPVAAIEGYLALALNAKVATVDNRARDYLEKAHTSTQHLGQLFQDLLTSAKAEDGRLTSHPVVVEMGTFLEQLSSDLRFAARTHR